MSTPTDQSKLRRRRFWKSLAFFDNTVPLSFSWPLNRYPGRRVTFVCLLFLLVIVTAAMRLLAYEWWRSLDLRLGNSLLKSGMHNFIQRYVLDWKLLFSILAALSFRRFSRNRLKMRDIRLTPLDARELARATLRPLIVASLTLQVLRNLMRPVTGSVGRGLGLRWQALLNSYTYFSLWGRFRRTHDAGVLSVILCAETLMTICDFVRAVAVVILYFVILTSCRWLFVGVLLIMAIMRISARYDPIEQLFSLFQALAGFGKPRDIFFDVNHAMIHDSAKLFATSVLLLLSLWAIRLHIRKWKKIVEVEE